MFNYNPNTVKVTHLPTGISATCESQRSQHRNKALALALLRARLWAQANLAPATTLVANYRLPDETSHPDDLSVYRRDTKPLAYDAAVSAPHTEPGL